MKKFASMTRGTALAVLVALALPAGRARAVIDSNELDQGANSVSETAFTALPISNNGQPLSAATGLPLNLDAVVAGIVFDKPLGSGKAAILEGISAATGTQPTCGANPAIDGRPPSFTATALWMGTALLPALLLIAGWRKLGRAGRGEKLANQTVLDKRNPAATRLDHPQII